MSRPFIPAANCASIELIYLQNGVTCENIIHVRKATPYSAADLTSLRGTVDSWDNVTGKTLRSSLVTLTRIRTKALDSLGSPIEDYTLPAARAGTLAGTLLPGNVAYCLKLSTGLTGRSYRGRVYMVGMTANNYGTTSNQVSAAASAVFVAGWNTLLTNLAAAGHTLGVLSFMSNGAWRAAGLFTAATGFVAIDLNLDSMRRRLTGRGI